MVDFGKRTMVNEAMVARALTMVVQYMIALVADVFECRM
jgi:hypothetical protein